MSTCTSTCAISLYVFLYVIKLGTFHGTAANKLYEFV